MLLTSYQVVATGLKHELTLNCTTTKYDLILGYGNSKNVQNINIVLNVSCIFHRKSRITKLPA